MRAKKFHGLKRVKFRQTWNKYNLYNLTRLKSPINPIQTYFQQKWYAKSQARAYHGETMLEKPWKRMFTPQIRSVIPLNPKDLAQNDGSNHAAGRGSGLEAAELPRGGRVRKMARLPYMNMTFAPTERRLDVAIWRALFASSARQARQFVIHGYVKVNGQKMIYPAYQLNPGDMFQVDPERVMFATGAPKKKPRSSIKSREKKLKEASEEAAEQDAEESASAETSEEASDAKTLLSSAIDQAEGTLDAKATLTSLLEQAKDVLSTDTNASAKRKRALREFKRLVRRTLSRKDTEPDVVGDLEAQLVELTSKLNVSVTSASEGAEATDKQSTTARPRTLTTFEKKQLEDALAAMRENPVDPSKPYATPWRPRNYMSAFAFVPRYLEVHHPICSAVYLRHPVVRPGLAEVPTPFTSEVLGLVFNWYLKRR